MSICGSTECNLVPPRTATEPSCQESNAKYMFLCEGAFQLIIHLEDESLFYNYLDISPMTGIITHYHIHDLINSEKFLGGA